MKRDIRFLAPLLSVFLVTALYAGNARAGSAEKEAGKPADFMVELLNDASLIEIYLADSKDFMAWGKEVLDGLKPVLAGLKPGGHLLVQITLRPKAAASFEVFGNPRLPPKRKAGVLALLNKKPAPKVKFSGFSFRFISGKPSEGAKARMARFPAVKNPNALKRQAFRASTTAEQYKALREWARNEALPILSAFALRADPRFKGVRNMGKLLKKTDYTKPFDVAKMTEKNPDFWRGVLEMSLGNQLIASSQIFLYAAEGKLDRAKLLLDLTIPFAGPKAYATALMRELNWRLRTFVEKVNKDIEKGIKLHDAGKREAALRCYRAVLKSYPFSAWAHYEVYHTKFVMASLGDAGSRPAEPDWKVASRSIYASDPLYTCQYRATTGKEAYELLRRLEAKELFQDPKKAQSDFLKYAGIAADLNERGTAALLYYRAFTSFGPKVCNRGEMLKQFLFNLEQLGVTSIKDNFKGDHAADFKKIKQEQQARMQKSPAYKAMRKKK